jgi:hypothetical protein
MGVASSIPTGINLSPHPKSLSLRARDLRIPKLSFPILREGAGVGDEGKNTLNRFLN